MMGESDTPPHSPCMEEEYIEEFDENDLELIEDDQNIEALNSNVDDYGESDEDVMEILEKDNSLCVFDKHVSSVFYICVSHDDKYAATGGEDDKAYIWDVKTGEVFFEYGGHKDSVIFTGFTYDDQYFVTGDMSGFIQLWTMTEPVVVWDYNMGDVTWMHLHHMSRVLLAGSVEGEIYMWKLPGGECRIIQGFGKRVEMACLLQDGVRLVVGYEDGVIRVIDLKQSKIINTIGSNTGHFGAITSLDCHLDNNLIISAAIDGKTIVSAANTGKVISVLQSLGGELMEDDGDELAGSGNWVEAVAFLKDPNQKIAATASLNGEIFIWDVAKQVLRHKIEQESGITKLVWRDSNSFVFSAGLDGITRCFDAKSGEKVRNFIGHTQDVLDLCITNDGKRILTCSDDSTARVFEVDTTQ